MTDSLKDPTSGHAPEDPTGSRPSSPADSCGCAHGIDADEGAHHHGYIADKARYLTRLRRIEGQVRGVHRMVDEDKYCIDILTQIAALTSALENVALGLLDDHLRHCVADAARLGGAAADEKFEEASRAIARLVKS